MSTPAPAKNIRKPQSTYHGDENRDCRTSTPTGDVGEEERTEENQEGKKSKLKEPPTWVPSNRYPCR